MPMTQVYCKVELFGSHCVVGMCGHGNVGFTEAVMLLCSNAGGLCAFLLCVGSVGAVAPILQPCASQTLRCIQLPRDLVKLQALIQQIWGRVGESVFLRSSQ